MKGLLLGVLTVIVLGELGVEVGVLGAIIIGIIAGLIDVVFRNER